VAAPSRHRSSATVLALVFAALVLYASLYPFAGWRWPPGQPLTALLLLPWPPWRDPFDAWANALGYLPLGLLAMLAARRSGVGNVPALVLALGAASLLSYGAEVLQQFVPGRHPSLKDWAANTTGAFAGALLAALVQAAGLIDRWQQLRERWFDRDSAGALALLALWPAALLFPAPVPLALGQIGERLREWALAALAGAPWAVPAVALLGEGNDAAETLRPLSEACLTGLGLLGPCLLAYAVVAPGWRRAALALAVLAAAAGAMSLAMLLNFGPGHVLAWLTPVTPAALLGATVLALLLAPLPRRVTVGLALVVLTALVVLVAQAPADPFALQGLMVWEQGRWVRLNGLTQWFTWLWPYAAMAWLLSRLGRQR
jgi:VanZ family protein